ncbi:histidine phosphatase family protein [Paludibacterium purpuratum]|uniref:Phosphoglycerate mutase n=1 Tax=Paludibacterium purpuratum TaxID=1144873 RepID=A0A4R7AUJ5_9NEIS|nr:histidine phosphatase family protein [Paludibacterium purpuratum]TDR70637.1 phosphoglycerate mutase [Paludibacterium purpuratum]
MSQTTRFCLVRHGETDWNIEHRLQGQIDIRLNDVGQQQAEQLSQALAHAGHGFAALYVSDLARARQTADAISRHNGLAPIATERLRERHFGPFQGLTYAEAEVRIPEAYRQFKSRDPAYVPGSGESLEAFQHRVHCFLDETAARHPGQTILVVSHGGVLDIAYRRANDLPITRQRDFPIPNAALNWISHCDGRWQLDRWADESHLAHSRDEI